MRYLTAFFMYAFACMSMHGIAHEVTFDTVNGEHLVFEVQPEESIDSIVQTLNYFRSDETSESTILQMNVLSTNGNLIIKAVECSKEPPRDYYIPFTDQEKKDLSYILKTLANASLAKIAKERSNIKKTGDRLENLHPFKFMEIIFTDEELKVCIRNLQGRSWVWGEFRDGLTNSLAKESAVDNIKPDHIQNLANTIRVDVNIITPLVESKNWSKLFTDLIALVPRSGNSGRYNQ